MMVLTLVNNHLQVRITRFVAIRNMASIWFGGGGGGGGGRN